MAEGARRVSGADLSVAITSAFEPGLYLAEFVSLVDGSASLAPLTVRDPAGREPLLVQLSAATWAAYNPYGGASLYNGFRFAGPVGTTRGASNGQGTRKGETGDDRDVARGDARQEKIAEPRNAEKLFEQQRAHDQKRNL